MGKATSRVSGWWGTDSILGKPLDPWQYLLHCLALKQLPFPAGLAPSGPATFFSSPKPLCSFPQSLFIFSTGLGNGSPLGSHRKEGLLPLVRSPQGSMEFLDPSQEDTLSLYVPLCHILPMGWWDLETSCFSQGWKGMSKEKEGKENALSVRKHILLCKILGWHQRKKNLVLEPECLFPPKFTCRKKVGPLDGA